MTTVYGVTFVGARDQIEKQLLDRGDISAEKCWVAASYVAKKVSSGQIVQSCDVNGRMMQVLASIGDLFQGAKDIQKWLALSARLIARSVPPERAEHAFAVEQPKKRSNSKPINRMKKEQMTAVIWTTPIGLPIVQPYRATKRKQITTHLQTVYIADPNVPTPGKYMSPGARFLF